MLTDVAIVGQVLEDGAPNFEGIHGPLRFEQHVSLPADEHCVRHSAAPAGVKSGYGIRGI
jgi:hypothetical protein